MKRKKLLAMLLVTAMGLGSAMTAMAADDPGVNTTGTTVTGTGDVSYVETTVYNVTLPTTTAIQLTVDPQGLTTLQNGDSATKEDLASAAGKVTCSTIVPVTNEGSVPVKVTVELALTGDATAVTSEADVEKDTNANVLLYAVPSAVDTKDATGYQGSTTGIVLSSTAASVNFVLPEAAYKFSKDNSGVTTYVRDTTSDSHGTAIKFEGKVNKKADWKDYVTGATSQKSIGMTAKFTFTHTLTTTDVADTTDGAPYGMMAYAGTKVTVAAEPVAPAIPESDGSTDIVITYAGADPTAGAIEVTRPDGTKFTPAAGAYTAKIVINTTDKTVTLTSAWLAGQKSNATGTYSMTIDGTEYEFKLN